MTIIKLSRTQTTKKKTGKDAGEGGKKLLTVGGNVN
jgi:hypothetical protein